MRPPIAYYGGKQRMVAAILPLIPDHVTYTEPFFGGGSIFWAKEPSKVEVINDTNREIINFYDVIRNDYIKIEKLIRASLHSRSLHEDATVVYKNPHLFGRIKRAWAVWVIANQSFSSILGGSWGYEKSEINITRFVANKRESFIERYARRLLTVQIECTDALRVIKSRDTPDTFHYCDPPYHNAFCAHYKGYNFHDFEKLLKTLESLKGKFLLSSYTSDLLSSYASENGWCIKRVAGYVSVASGVGTKEGKRKTEVLTANYPI